MAQQLVSGPTKVNEGNAPAPTLTADEFRAKFTEEHRAALYEATLALWREKTANYSVAGLSPAESGHRAHLDLRVHREALQCISGLHPGPYNE